MKTQIKNSVVLAILYLLLNIFYPMKDLDAFILGLLFGYLIIKRDNNQGNRPGGRRRLKLGGMPNMPRFNLKPDCPIIN